MTRTRSHSAIVALSTAMLFAALPIIASGQEINRTTEKELHVVLTAGFGRVTIQRGQPDKIFVGHQHGDKHESAINYEVRNRTGYLRIDLGEAEEGEGEKKKGAHVHLGGEWTLRFTDAIPISFDIEMGVTKSEIDLTGLRVKDFNLSSGASDVLLTCEAPNPLTMNELSIECGVSKFTGRNLGNTKFKHFRFEGGVGSATLDFDGEQLAENLEADIVVGLGVCTIILPEHLGTKILYEDSFISHISLARDIRGSAENEYISDNYNDARSHILLNVSAGLGSVRVKRKEK